MIRLGVVVLYIGLNQKWSATKVEATGDHIVVNRKFFTNFGANFHYDKSDILLPDPDIQGWVKYPMTLFLIVTFYWEKAHDWYLTITHRR